MIMYSRLDSDLMSEPVRQHSSKRLVFADMGDVVFFWESMYENCSEGDFKKGYIKYSAQKDTNSDMIRQECKKSPCHKCKETIPQVEFLDQLNSSAFVSSVSSNDSFVDKIHGQAAGEHPVVRRPLPYFKSALVKKIEPLEEAKGIQNAQVKAFNNNPVKDLTSLESLPESLNHGLKDDFLEQMPHLNASLHSALMLALQDERNELELKLAESTDQVKQDHLKRELWVIAGVSKFGLKSDQLHEIAQHFAQNGEVPTNYPGLD